MYSFLFSILDLYVKLIVLPVQSKLPFWNSKIALFYSSIMPWLFFFKLFWDPPDSHWSAANRMRIRKLIPSLGELKAFLELLLILIKTLIIFKRHFQQLKRKFYRDFFFIFFSFQYLGWRWNFILFIFDRNS